MNSKNTNQYKVLLQEVALKDGSKGEQAVEIDVFMREDIFHIMEKLNASGWFAEEADSRQFALGLKLFAEVMIKNRKNPLFEDFQPAFVELMKKIKSR